MSAEPCAQCRHYLHVNGLYKYRQPGTTAGNCSYRAAVIIMIILIFILQVRQCKDTRTNDPINQIPIKIKITEESTIPITFFEKYVPIIINLLLPTKF